jgi:DNA-binding response OmpR family regulator
LNILIVDDEPGILEPVQVFLESTGTYRVVTASSGAEALAVIEAAEVDFDCLLVDIQMPQMDGIRLCELVRAMPGYSHVPIIMLTAMSQRAYINKAFSIGATDYITKPFDLLEVRDRLNSAARTMRDHERGLDQADAAKHRFNALGIEIKSDPDEAVSLDGLENVVSYATFENFLMTLPRSKLLFASTFAVKIVDFVAVHEALTRQDLQVVLTSVAQAVADLISSPGNLVCYRGNGLFLCICQKKSSATSADRQVVINQALFPLKSPELTRDIRVVVGPETSLLSISRPGAFEALRKAVDSVELLVMPVKEVARYSKRILRTQSRSQEQSKLDRRAYEVVLEEIIRDNERRGSLLQ